VSKVRVHITVSVDGYVDELELHIVPQVLGGGARLFDGVGPDLKLEQVRAVDAPGVTHVKYRVVRGRV
jgi:dihydrofolate reductase